MKRSCPQASKAPTSPHRHSSCLQPSTPAVTADPGKTAGTFGAGGHRAVPAARAFALGRNAAISSSSLPTPIDARHPLMLLPPHFLGPVALFRAIFIITFEGDSRAGYEAFHPAAASQRDTQEPGGNFTHVAVLR